MRVAASFVMRYLAIRRLRGFGAYIGSPKEYKTLPGPIRGAARKLKQWFKNLLIPPTMIFISGITIDQYKADLILRVVRLSCIQFLNISECIADEEPLLKILAACSDLRNVSLNNTCLSDKIFEVLLVSPRLQTIAVFGTKVTQQGVHAMQQARPTCRIGWDGIDPDLDWWKENAFPSGKTLNGGSDFQESRS